MKKLTLAIIAAGSISLGGCAGFGDPTGGLGTVLGSVLGGGGGDGYYGQGGPDFQEVAVDACGNQASRYGQVRITDVRQASRDTMHVHGTVSNNFQQRSFGCAFRSDGRITDFDIQ